jgi:hypothetical protein
VAKVAKRIEQVEASIGRYLAALDRAAFHFLTTVADQQAYVRVLVQAVKNGGKAVTGDVTVTGNTAFYSSSRKSHDNEIRNIANCDVPLKGEHQELWGN